MNAAKSKKPLKIILYLHQEFLSADVRVKGLAVN